MKTLVFVLPDLGEGLPDAEIVEWAIQVGDHVLLDGPLVSMETAKAVVDVPSPVSGKLIKIFGQKGDIIETGKPLAEFELSGGPQRAQGHDTGHAHAATVATQHTTENAEADAGSVVGAVSVSNQLQTETPITLGGVKALPAVRALAKKLGVDLARIAPTGFEGSVSLADVKSYASNPQLQNQTALSAARLPQTDVVSERISLRFDQNEPLRGVRRNMARMMAEAHASVVPTTLTEDADLHQWDSSQDVTARLIRAMVAAARAEPGLNAWFDGKENARTVHTRVDIGIAIDTEEGLFVAALRQAQNLDQLSIKNAVRRLREQVHARSLPPTELSGYTLMLSNFGMYAGRYATPVVAPPCVSILAAGRARMQLVPVLGGIATHRILPLSLTFDHRACTGGEAARFLRALLDDLQAGH